MCLKYQIERILVYAVRIKILQNIFLIVLYVATTRSKYRHQRFFLNYVANTTENKYLCRYRYFGHQVRSCSMNLQSNLTYVMIRISISSLAQRIYYIDGQRGTLHIP